MVNISLKHFHLPLNLPNIIRKQYDRRLEGIDNLSQSPRFLFIPLYKSI